MSLALKLKSFVDAVGADIKQLFQSYTNLANNKVVYLPLLQITITESTTSIPVAYTPGMIKVYQAGIRLREGDDFTATTGVTLQFNYTLLAGDEIDIERISVENAPGMIAQEQTDWNATSGITSIANKPDFIAAGSTAAAARNVIDVSSRDQALPEYYLVDAIGAYTAGGTVTLGDQIPGASTGVVWAVGKIIGVTSGGETGAVLSVIAGGTLSSDATSTAKNTASNGGGGSVFARFFRYKYGNTYLYLRTSGGGYLYGDLGSSQTTELWHVLSGGSKVSLNDYLGTVGEVANLTTTDKTSLVAAINEVKASTATKTLNSKSIAGTGNIDIALRNTSNYAAFDTTAKSVTIGLDTAKTTATFTTGQSVVRSDKGVTLGTAGLKLYFEITFVSGTASGNSSIGVTGASPILTSQLGYDGLAVGEIAVFQNSGNVYANAVTTSIGSGTSFSAAGSVVGVAVDITNKKIWFRTNNGIWNNNAANNPETGVGGFNITGTDDIYPAVCTDSAAVFKLNAGAEAFAFTPPTGFTEWFTSVIVDTIVPTDVQITSPVTDEILSYNGTKWVNSKRQITVSTTAPASPVLNQLWLDIS